jgi:hypothetical protein
MSKVYLIMGYTGEYGDAQSWPVKAFHREVDCQQMVSAMNSYLKVTMGKYSPYDLYFAHEDSDSIGKTMKEIRSHMEEHYDPLFQMDYTGTNYSYMEIPAKLRG